MERPETVQRIPGVDRKCPQRRLDRAVSRVECVDAAHRVGDPRLEFLGVVWKNGRGWVWRARVQTQVPLCETING